jgi:hypothetical protein
MVTQDSSTFVNSSCVDESTGQSPCHHPRSQETDLHDCERVRVERLCRGGTASGPRPTLTENARGQKVLWNQLISVKSDLFSIRHHCFAHKQQQHVCTQEGENRVAHCQRCAVRHRRVHHRVRVHSNGIASPPLLPFCGVALCGV